MNIENKIIDTLNHLNVNENEITYISNSIINIVDFETLELNNEIIIEGCIIKNFLIHSCWFRNGLTLRKSQISSYIDYQMGGHNERPIIINDCIFYEFVNFFDCQFISNVELINNIFMKGSNLLGNQDEGFKNSFEINALLTGNIGNLSLDGIGR